MDVCPVTYEVWSGLVFWLHRDCGGPEHGTRTWSTEEERKERRRGNELDDRRPEERDERKQGGEGDVKE